MSRQWARRAMTVTEAEAGCTGSFLEATGSGKAGLASRKGHADTPMAASGSWCARPADPAPSPAPAQPQRRPRRPLRVRSDLPTSQQATSKHLLRARSFSRRKRPTKGRVRKGRRGRKGTGLQNPALTSSHLALHRTLNPSESQFPHRADETVAHCADTETHHEEPQKSL